ncbi:hypothetical protein GOODEAATRI_031237, partial [Goodea atripinnis]
LRLKECEHLRVPDCLLVRLYGSVPSSSSGRVFLDFSGVYSSGGSGETKKKNLKSYCLAETSDADLTDAGLDENCEGRLDVAKHTTS